VNKKLKSKFFSVLSLRKYNRIYKFHKGTGRVKAFQRVLDNIIEIDVFDLSRPGILTGEIKTDGYTNFNYMPYWPAYTSVTKEMIRQAHNYYISAVMYANRNRKSIFLDLGSGPGKNVILAAESGKFSHSFGVDIEKDLVVLGNENLFKLRKIKRSLKDAHISIFEGNAEEQSFIDEIDSILAKSKLNPKDTTLFVYNKNSYGPAVLSKSLSIIESKFDSIFYLYQNPVQQKILFEHGYELFASDAKPNNAHKNYKYSLFLKHTFRN